MEIKNVEVMESMKKEVNKKWDIKKGNVVEVVKESMESGKMNKSEGIRVLFLNNMEVGEISKELGIIYNMCYNIVFNFMVKNGIEFESSKRESKKDKVIELLNSGMGNKDICIELKCNYNYVLKIKKELKEKGKLIEVK